MGQGLVLEMLSRRELPTLRTSWLAQGAVCGGARASRHVYQKLEGTASAVVPVDDPLQNAEAETNGTSLLQSDEGRWEREQHESECDEAAGG